MTIIYFISALAAIMIAAKIVLFIERQKRKKCMINNKDCFNLLIRHSSKSIVICTRCNRIINK